MKKMRKKKTKCCAAVGNDSDRTKDFKKTSRVDFLKVGSMAQIIEIALSICALLLRPTFEKLFTGVNVRRRPRKIGAGLKTVYEIGL